MKGPDISSQASLPTPNSTKSFWHSEPSEILLGHRTTSSLPTKTDVVIIGSGISGAFAAHWLREDENGKSLDIVMLEAREACWGATGRVSAPLTTTANDLISQPEWRPLPTYDVLFTSRDRELRDQKLRDCGIFDLKAQHPMRLESPVRLPRLQ